MSEERYKLFEKAFTALKKAQKTLSKAPELADLNVAEREAREALYNLQFTVGGLAYWIQDTATKRRQEIQSRPPVAIEELIKEEAKSKKGE